LAGYTGTITGWESQTNCSGNWLLTTVTGSGASVSVTPTVNTCYRANISSGVCPTTLSSVATIQLEGGAVAPSIVKLCNPSPVNLAVSGNAGTITGWQSQANCMGAWTNIVGSGSAITITPPIGTTCYRAIGSSPACPTFTSLPTTVQVDIPVVTGQLALAINAAITRVNICPTDNVNLKVMGFTGKVINWQSNALTSPAWVNVPNSNDKSTLTVNGASLMTTFYRVCICSPLGICPGTKSLAYSNTFRVSIKSNCNAVVAPFVNKEKVENTMSIDKAYPMPSKNNISIDVNGATEGDAQIEIMNVMGQLVKRESQYLQEGINVISLDISALSKGMHIVRFTDRDKQTSMIKIMKED
jgi:Secretion system C-terminal sorting domain